MTISDGENKYSISWAKYGQDCAVITGLTGNVSITFKNISFVGGTGAVRVLSAQGNAANQVIVFNNCEFKNVYHVAYFNPNSQEGISLSIINCKFEECQAFYGGDGYNGTKTITGNTYLPSSLELMHWPNTSIKSNDFSNLSNISAYYDSTIDISDNYWGEETNPIIITYAKDTKIPDLTSYYSKKENGTLSDQKNIEAYIETTSEDGTVTRKYYDTFEDAVNGKFENDIITLIRTNETKYILKKDKTVKVKEVDPAKLSIEADTDLTLFINEEDEGVKTYKAGVAVAQIGETPYPSLQAAVDAAENTTGNITVKLIADTTEKVTVTQKAGLDITILGNENKYPTINGQILIDGRARNDKPEKLTIKYINFEYPEGGLAKLGGDGILVQGAGNNVEGFITCYSSWTSPRPDITYSKGAHNVTISNCSFNSKKTDLTEKNVIAYFEPGGGGGVNISLDHLDVYNLFAAIDFYSVQTINISYINATDVEYGLVCANHTINRPTINYCNIKSNKASLVLSQVSDFILENNTFESNEYAILAYKNTGTDCNSTTVINSGEYVGDIKDEGISWTFTLSGGSLTGNIEGNGTVTITDGTVTGNVSNGGTLSISGGTISGDVTATAGTTTITSGKIGGTVSKSGKGKVEIRIEEATPPVFTNSPSAEYCVDCHPIPNTAAATKDDYPYTVGSGDSVASITSKGVTTYYTSFADAVKAAGESTIVLLKDVESDYDLSNKDYSPLKVQKGEFTLTVKTTAENKAISSSTEDGITTYTLVSMVAKIGEKNYGSFADALADSKAGDEIKLLADVTLTEDLSFPEGFKEGLAANQKATLTLTLGEYKISKDKCNFYLPENVTLTASKALEADENYLLSPPDDGYSIIKTAGDGGKFSYTVGIGNQEITTETEANTAVNQSAEEKMRQELGDEGLAKAKETIRDETKVSDVELKGEGTQNLITAAESGLSTDDKALLENASTIDIKIAVSVTLTDYSSTSISFEVTPTATITAKDEHGLQALTPIEGVSVTNDMINQDNPIEVTIYTGKQPEQLIHRDSKGNVQIFNKSQITYDDTTKTSTVKIYHFSTLDVLLKGAIASYTDKTTGGVKYTNDLQEAVDNAKDGSTINIVNHATPNTTVELNNKNLTIDLNDKTILSSATPAFSITGGSTVTIKDSGTSGKIQPDSGAAISVSGNATALTIEGGTISSGTNGSAIEVANESSLNIEKATISSTKDADINFKESASKIPTITSKSDTYKLPNGYGWASAGTDTYKAVKAYKLFITSNYVDVTVTDATGKTYEANDSIPSGTKVDVELKKRSGYTWDTTTYKIADNDPVEFRGGEITVTGDLEITATAKYSGGTGGGGTPVQTYSVSISRTPTAAADAPTSVPATLTGLSGSNTITVTAKAAKDSYEFDGWYEGSTRVSTSLEYKFTTSAAKTLIATYKTKSSTDAKTQAFLDDVKALPDASKATSANRAAVDKALADYKNVPDADKTRADVVAAKKTLDAVNDAVTADEVADKIEALPASPTLSDKDKVDAANTAYKALTPAQQALVPTADVTKLNNAVKAIEQAEADKAAADEADTLIKALPTSPTLDDKDQVDKAKKKYDDLTAAQKALVPPADVTKLNNAVKAIEEAEAEKAAADKRAAQIVEDLIKDLPDPSKVTSKDKAAVDAVKKRYDDLTPDQQALVSDESKTKLQKDIEALQSEDQKVVERFTAAVNAVPGAAAGTEKGLLEKATAIYAEMTDAQKAIVTRATMNLYEDELAHFKRNYTFRDGDAWFKVLSNGDVTYLKPASRNITSATVPEEAKDGSYKYRVIKVSNNAFRNCKNLKWVVVAKTVYVFGQYVFARTPKLATVKVMGTNFKSPKATDAFFKAGKSSGLTVKAPKSKVSSYSKLFKGEGRLNGEVIAA